MQNIRTTQAGQTSARLKPRETAKRPSHQMRQTGRSGFSLVELLMVILIIAVLMALILPAIGSVRRAARNTAVKVEIDQLSTAMSQFERRFGKLPPSFLIIPGDGEWSDTGTGTAAMQRNVALQYSKRRIRELWPRFNFLPTPVASANGGLGTLATGDLVLSGDEMLAFALGGIQTSAGQALGFSKNPRLPFAGTGDNRDGPFFTDWNGRLVDFDGDGFRSFVDSLPGQTAPYLFVSTGGGNSYPDLTANLTAYGDAADFNVFPGTGKNPVGPYYNSSGVAWKANSFQVISPGADGLYGDPNSTDANYVGEGVYDEGGNLSKREQDNITNFSGSTLGG